MNDFKTFYNKIFPFWNSLSHEDIENLCQFTTEVNYHKGQNVHGGDGNCTGAIIVKKGCLRTYMLSEDGKEITLYRLYDGDICVLSASCVLNSITFDVRVDAEEDSNCLVLNGKVFSNVAEHNLSVKNYALEMAVSRFSDVMWTMQQILFMSFDKRLAVFLHDEMINENSNVIKLSNEQIAKYMCSAREVVSRMLKYFKAEGIAERTKDGVVILDKKKLDKLISQHG